MARRAKAPKLQKTGLFHAREARRMSRSELVRRSGVSKQQLSRLENGLIRLRLDHLKPFANALGYSPEQILLWGRFPGTGDHIESSDVLPERGGREELVGPAKGQVPELDTRAGLGHCTIGKEIIVLDETTSTNDVVLQMANEGAREGLVVFAERQTAGRGQRGNVWESSPGKGLLFSILLRPHVANLAGHR